jgi:hypothetical protein
VTRRTLASVALVAALTLGGCAARDVGIDRTPGAAVPTDLVPAGLPAHQLTIDADATTDVRDAIAAAGPQLLVGDARMWDIHLGQRLVGALQLSTLRSRVDPRRQEDRDAIVGQALGSRARQVLVRGLPVWTVPDDGAKRGVYVWFGAHTFGVLQIKGDGVDTGAVADELISHIAAQPGWQALPPQAYRTTKTREKR